MRLANNGTLSSAHRPHSLWQRVLCAVAGLPLLLPTGCVSLWQAKTSEPSDAYVEAATSIEYPDLNAPPESYAWEVGSPHTLGDEADHEYWDMTLQEAIRAALVNSRILRNLGGVVLQSPETVPSVYDPAIQYSDPRFGTQAALSAFDASFAANAFFEHNDRALNNVFFGGGTRTLKQEAAVFQSQIQKRAATGTEFSIRNITEYDQNNAPGNAFPAAWDVLMEGEFRHPLLQGGGVDFNRIAGPSETPGVYGGVLIARVNNDVSIADFEIGVRDFISDVENAYWDLYFAYRDLDAKIEARNAALETWRRMNALYTRGRVDADKEAQAREQYWRLQEEVQLALTGRLVEGTRSGAGTRGGVFNAVGGVYVTERRLRFLIGVAVNDNRLIRAVDEPPRAPVVFDWDLALTESLTKRAELRRQKWMIKRRELELVASRNFLLPELDVIGLYRWRGFGRGFTGDDAERFDSALQNLANGDFQEWQVGMELNFPFGARQAHAAVRHAELNLAREKSVLQQQERQIVHDLSNAIAEVDRAHEVLQTVHHRVEATRAQLESLQAAFDADRAPLNLVLDAQRRLAIAESRYYAVLVEYALAIKNTHLEKGSLLEYCGIHLAEGPWPTLAYDDARERNAHRTPAHTLTDHAVQTGVISAGEEVRHVPGGTLPPAVGHRPITADPVLVEPIEPAAPIEPTPANELEDRDLDSLVPPPDRLPGLRPGTDGVPAREAPPVDGRPRPYNPPPADPVPQRSDDDREVDANPWTPVEPSPVSLVPPAPLDDERPIPLFEWLDKQPALQPDVL